MSAAASGAEVVTAGASEGAEEATGEDTALERWTQGQIDGLILYESPKGKFQVSPAH